MGDGGDGWGAARNVKRRSGDGGKEVIEEKGRVGGIAVTEEREVGGVGGWNKRRGMMVGVGDGLEQATMVSYLHETIING